MPVQLNEERPGETRLRNGTSTVTFTILHRTGLSRKAYIPA